MKKLIFSFILLYFLSNLAYAQASSPKRCLFDEECKVSEICYFNECTLKDDELCHYNDCTRHGTIPDEEFRINDSLNNGINSEESKNGLTIKTQDGFEYLPNTKIEEVNVKESIIQEGKEFNKYEVRIDGDETDQITPGSIIIDPNSGQLIMVTKVSDEQKSSNSFHNDSDIQYLPKTGVPNIWQQIIKFLKNLTCL